MIKVVFKCQVAPEMRDQVIQRLERLAKMSRQEEGCIECVFFAGVDYPCELLVFEAWESEASLEAHKQSEHFRELYHTLREELLAYEGYMFTGNRDATDVILDRRSIRSFLPDPIAHRQVERIIRAGMYAPTAFNVCPWEFVVLDAPEDRNRIVESWPFLAPLRVAPVGIVLCANMTDIQPGHEWWVQDLSAAMQNMQLQAEADGLGSVWMGFYPDIARVEKLGELLNLPSHLKPFAILAFGKPGEKIERPERFDRNKIHYGRF